MSEPERWLTSTEAPGGMSEMLSAAQKVGPSAVERAALAGKLGVATSGLWIAPALKGLAATVVVAGGVWGAVNLAGTPSATSAPPGDVSSQATPAGATQLEMAAPAVEPPAIEPPAIEPQEVPAADAASEPEQKAESRPATPAAQKAQPSKPSEISLIARAKRDVDTSPRKALAALSEHSKLYPSGVLAEEREVLRIRALKSLGREEAAQAQEEKFRKEHPESVHHVP